jgi:mannose-6-phosphate isomerase
MCVDGSFELKINTEIFYYQKGDTVLIPAALTNFELSGSASILEIYIS